jgi:hypothetical protein
MGKNMRKEKKEEERVGFPLPSSSVFVVHLFIVRDVILH